MSAPNLLVTANCYGNTTLASLTTVTANVLTNTSSSNSVIKLNTVVLANYSGSAVTANVLMNRSSTAYYIGGTVSIPANSTLVLLAKDTVTYMIEGDVLQANVSANTAVSLMCSYETLS
jgi:hypothetical protein